MTLRTYILIGGSIAAVIALWFLVVSPRLEIRDQQIEQQANDIKVLQAGAASMLADIASTKQAAADNAAAMDRLAKSSTQNDAQVVVIRDQIKQAASTTGPQPVGAASRAYYDAILKEQRQ